MLLVSCWLYNHCLWELVFIILLVASIYLSIYLFDKKWETVLRKREEIK